MLLAVQLATIAVATWPANLANDLPPPADATSRQLITVRAGTARSTYATARTWVRGEDGCWRPVGGPHRSGRQERRACEPTGGRRLDAGGPLSDRPDHVRQLTEPRR